MNKKLQVFVSSTYDDLKDERQATVEAILDAGHIPAGMELFKGGQSQLKTIKKWIDDSDVYLLILGGRYGSIDPNSQLSYIQIEYEYALSKNMPIFTIILEKSYLHLKASTMGEERVFETNKNSQILYDKFIKFVQTKLVRYANSIDSLKYNIITQLQQINLDDNYNLIGWVKADTTLNNLELFSENDLKKINTDIFKEVLGKHYKTDVTDLSNTIGKDIFNGINYKGLLDSVERTIMFLFLDNDKVKVTVKSILKYTYLDKEHQSYGIRFDATKEQANTFKVERLKIDGDDYTNDFKWGVVEHKERGQFVYRVQSIKSIPIKKLPCDINYTCSYICNRLDFFQAYRLPFPCRNLSVAAILLNESDKYSIIGSTFSTFSAIHSDDNKASEMDNYSICNLKLPKWSLSGAGYVLTLMKKSRDGHI